MSALIDALAEEIEETRKRLVGHQRKALELHGDVYIVQDLEDAEESCRHALLRLKPPPLKSRP